MADYYFERDVRTPHSEAYIITDGDQAVGRVDLHYTNTLVHATLCVGEGMTQEGIQELIEALDEEIVMSADTPRDDFVVVVHQGREVGIFSDQDFEVESEEEPQGM